jgi:hypothetical protein
MDFVIEAEYMDDGSMADCLQRIDIYIEAEGGAQVRVGLFAGEYDIDEEDIPRLRALFELDADSDEIAVIDKVYAAWLNPEELEAFAYALHRVAPEDRSYTFRELAGESRNAA